ncbi:hypothetical protein RCO48_34410, partial [Peribacillus frigoritolerans]|nr:hypothetical protein [Peribacillus frigoritolerans]
WERRLIPEIRYIRISRAYNRHFQLALHKQKRLEEEKKKSTHGTETIIGESADKRVQDSLIEKSSFQLRESSGLNESIMKDGRPGMRRLNPVFEESLEPVKEINDRKPVTQQKAIRDNRQNRQSREKLLSKSGNGDFCHPAHWGYIASVWRVDFSNHFMGGFECGPEKFSSLEWFPSFLQGWPSSRRS